MAVFKTLALGSEFVIRKEGPAAAAVTPGDLVEYTSAGAIRRHSEAGGNAQARVAIENELFGGGVTDAYAAGDQVLMAVMPRGTEWMANIAAGAAAIAVGDILESAGDGTLRKNTALSSPSDLTEEGGALGGVQDGDIVWHKAGAVTDSDTAAADGVALYVHVDDASAYGLPMATLEFVSPTNADGTFQIASGSDTVRVADNDSAASGGLQLYFDEDAANEDSRFMVNNTVTGTDVFVFTSSGHAIRIKHNASAASAGVAVYFDEDAANAHERIQFVSPTNADGAFWTDDEVGLVREQEGVRELAAQLNALTPLSAKKAAVAMAMEAVDNSGGVTAVRLRVEAL